MSAALFVTFLYDRMISHDGCHLDSEPALVGDNIPPVPVALDL